MPRLADIRLEVWSRTWVQAAALGVCLLGFFTWFHGQSPNLLGLDGYFHIRFAEILRADGLVHDFRWLPFTIYNKDFADDHFLFHVAMIPFTFGDLVAGAKLYATLAASAVFVSFFCILRSLRVRGPWIWTFGLLVASEPFLARMSLARAPSLSILVLLIATALVLHKRDRWIGPVAFAFVWLYGG